MCAHPRCRLRQVESEGYPIQRADSCIQSLCKYVMEQAEIPEDEWITKRAALAEDHNRVLNRPNARNSMKNGLKSWLLTDPFKQRQGRLVPFSNSTQARHTQQASTDFPSHCICESDYPNCFNLRQYWCLTRNPDGITDISVLPHFSTHVVHFSRPQSSYSSIPQSYLRISHILLPQPSFDHIFVEFLLSFLIIFCAITAVILPCRNPQI